MSFEDTPFQEFKDAIDHSIKNVFIVYSSQLDEDGNLVGKCESIHLNFATANAVMEYIRAEKTRIKPTGLVISCTEVAPSTNLVIGSDVLVIAYSTMDPVRFVENGKLRLAAIDFSVGTHKENPLDDHVKEIISRAITINMDSPMINRLAANRVLLKGIEKASLTKDSEFDSFYHEIKGKVWNERGDWLGDGKIRPIIGKLVLRK